MNFLATVVLLYPAILIGVSLWRSRVVKSHADFMVAGRSVPVLLLVGTLVCTWIGSGSLFGGAGLAYRTGIAELWFSFGAWMGLVVAYFIAGRVRQIAQYTVPDLLEQRYNAAARLLGTLAIILAYVTIAAYQFRGGGWILSIVTDGRITPTQGMYITAAAIVIFTALAGMVSIVTVDIFNGTIITLGIFFALPYMVFQAGGIGDVISRLPEGHISVLGGHNLLWVIGVALPTFLLLLGESGMYQKFFSAKDSAAARRAVIGMVLGVVLLETALALLAIVGRAVYPDLVQELSILGRAASETVILHIARYGLPTIGGAILLAAGVAIVLSTGNTFLLVPSTNVSRDIYERFINPGAPEARKLFVQRLSVMVFGVVGLILLTQFDTVLAMALYAYSLVGASLTPALLACFLWRRVTPQGGVACIAGGMGTIVAIGVLSRLGVGFSAVIAGTEFNFASSEYIVIPGVLVSIGLLVGVSLMTAPSPPEVWQPFFTKEELEPAIGDE
ncbi:MAG: sodium:solute symporter family protein [Gemmatimonadetes bacterium]|uniref:Sodium:solute symporter family protein n=1 Tax=Candidatus Kutchimonas denitrificans TaxID=3056748 RepID=A0AAE4Z6Q0_9BACT|nr:sodium:solute symporter family protein [Gemmatimonadota bacterium]NIR74739.1 sodium:solute symporter family protein [Candidatus Kutchimonas denitrificans]NIS01489.1 sodium:solute symporter family protein [Gemmatimonadota bacterium]NIT67230.1 sodium:solute symporter family protein [Gemmatimonadota bacterium]NIU52404.1 sodium:solute symporter family protein [Gemmatimonadota bacterium]